MARSTRGTDEIRHDHDKERSMAFPTAVNSQITDAVTQSNVKAIAESPAMAMGSLYQTIAHSTGILFENAVAAQQQQNTLAQAATTQGIMQIYSIDTTAAAAATQTSLIDHFAGLLAVLNAFKPQAETADAAVQPDAGLPDTNPVRALGSGAPAAAGIADGNDGVATAVKDAVRFANDTVLGHADGFNAGLRQCTDSFVHALERIQHVQEDALRRMLLDAAMAAALKAMLQEPQRAKEYEEVLQAIKRLG
jgi:hypothetical protein